MKFRATPTDDEESYKVPSRRVAFYGRHLRRPKFRATPTENVFSDDTYGRWRIVQSPIASCCFLRATPTEAEISGDTYGEFIFGRHLRRMKFRATPTED